MHHVQHAIERDRCKSEVAETGERIHRVIMPYRSV